MSRSKRVILKDLKISQDDLKKIKPTCQIRDECTRNKTLGCCFKCEKTMCGQCAFTTNIQFFCKNCTDYDN